MQIIKTDQILSVVQPYLPNNPIIVEAGAFTGRDTQRLAAFWPQGTIHSFEPVPEIFAQLTANTQHLPNVQRYQCALSAHQGTASFNVSHNPKKPHAPYPAGSLLKPKERLAWSQARYEEVITVPTCTLDYWAQQHNVLAVDFLWLDMQGNELAVMQAAPHTLAHARAIFTEVEFIEAYEGQPLYTDVQTWLESQGFTAIAQDFTNTTDWFFGNMLFVRNP